MKPIGLKRGTVKLASHQKEWEREFQKEKARILKACRDKIIAIEHVGSTSVHGLMAKPIIDISAGIKRFKDVDELIKPLAALGYHFYKRFQQQMLFAKGPDANRTHYLHVMRYNGAKWKTDMLFRDYLRSHPAEVRRYTELKKKLAKKYPDDRQKYSDGKDVFIKSIIAKAQKSNY